MPCFCFGITSDCSFGGYNAHQIDIKNVDEDGEMEEDDDDDDVGDDASEDMEDKGEDPDEEVFEEEDEKELVEVMSENITEFLEIFPQPERQAVVGMLMKGRLTR